MRDTAAGTASAQAHNSSPPIIRGMANTLCDTDTDLIDTTAVITRLVVAGWPSKQIEEHYVAAVMMAMARKINERRT
jgi:hypothetical protein